jgi:hypothetical protein
LLLPPRRKETRESGQTNTCDRWICHRMNILHTNIA